MVNIFKFLETRVSEDERNARARMVNDPFESRALREAAFKRYILQELHAQSWQTSAKRDGAPSRAALELAKVYIEHPDFDAKWLPSPNIT
ncbi:DUF6221 family protein [Mycobacterium adipatum]|uniref:DUF6221 family protein n=1 Tax=Mycobacterium adipatum TaxID=1682113 RepID=UPI003AAC0550